MFQWLQNIVCACTSKDTFDITEFEDDPMAWSVELEEHELGEFSMAAVQANGLMEDRSQLEIGVKSLFVGIYDGHRGDITSKFLSENLFPNLLRHIRQNDENMSENILRQVVAEIEEQVMTSAEAGYQQNQELGIVGSSCLICIVWKGTLYIANVGDSRAVIGSKGLFTALSVQQLVRDHSASNDHIQQELMNLHKDDHSIVMHNFGEWRVKGIYDVSRAIGNAYLKRRPFTLNPSFQVEVPHSEYVNAPFTRPVISAEPEIYSKVLKDSDKFIIFGSGGLWKLLSNKQAAEIVNTNRRDGIARRIVMFALEIAAKRNEKTYGDLKDADIGYGVSSRGPGVSVAGTRREYHDDISVIVVFFDKKQDQFPPPLIMPVLKSFRGFSDRTQASAFNIL